MDNQNKQKKDDLDILVPKTIPDAAFILAKTDKKINIISLDEYPIAQHSDLYMDATRRYGEDNIRYCKVVTVKVTQNVEFMDKW